VKILALPRDPNPYQGLFYGELVKHGASVRYAGELTGSQTLNLLLLPLEVAVRRVLGWRVIHLHWVFRFVPGGADRVPALRRFGQVWFRGFLRFARAIGSRIVWTAHNTLPHAQVFHDDVAARRSLLEASDLVVAHSSASLNDLRRRIGAEPRRAVIIPLGPSLPDLDGAALRSPGTAGGPLKLLFLGKIFEYKGVEELLTAMKRLPAERAQLTVVGQCPDPALRARLERSAADVPDRVTLRLEYVSDDEVTAAMADADVVVLPFRRITTSSSVMLALEHGRPVVLPDVPSLAHVPADCSVRYDGTVDDLVATLGELTRWPADRLERAGAAATDYANTGTWADAAELTMTALHDLDRAR
jgi:glycosyltransferase involved in cell wall biosynthesis